MSRRIYVCALAPLTLAGTVLNNIQIDGVNSIVRACDGMTALSGSSLEAAFALRDLVREIANVPVGFAQESPLASCMTFPTDFLRRSNFVNSLREGLSLYVPDVYPLSAPGVSIEAIEPNENEVPVGRQRSTVKPRPSRQERFPPRQPIDSVVPAH